MDQGVTEGQVWRLLVLESLLLSIDVEDTEDELVVDSANLELDARRVMVEPEDVS